MSFLARLWFKPRGFALDVLPVLVYLVLLFWLGLAPLQQLPGPDFDFADKVWHFIAFSGLAALLSRLLRHGGRREPPASRAAALASAGVGGLLELLQSLTPYRAAELADFVADALGALVAYLGLRYLARFGAGQAASAGSAA